MKPWNVEVFGSPIEIGDFATIIATSDNKVRFAVWSNFEGGGKIKIGKYSLICPGARITARLEITIGDNCMIASHAYITDSDWHGIYNRIDLGKSLPVRIKNNVWIGDSAIICKGVTIGDNSIIGAAAVVVDDVEENTVVAGNPAKVIKRLDSNEKFITRENWFSEPSKLSREFDEIDRMLLEKNTIVTWLRSIFFPTKGD
ncbi:MAG: acyltransferase [Desulfobacterales bacterium]|nr:acyltransferase [Desulfobacterales bacterium]MBF0395330.1 acyltransferase [Desulfobacterales bacterium]